MRVRVRACVRACVCACAYSSALAALPNELCKIRSKKTPRNPASKTGPGTVHLRRLPFSCNDWLTCASVSDLHPLTVPSSPSETFRLSVSWMCCFCCLIVSLSHCCSRAFRIKLHTFIPPNLSPKCNLHLAWMLTPFLNRFLTGAAFERILFGGGKTSLFCMSFSANCTTSNFSNMVRRLFARGGSGRCFSSSLRTFALAPVLSRLTWFRRASTKFLVLCFSIVLATTLVRASWSLAFFLWAESDSCSYCLWEMTWRPFAFWCSSSKVCKAKKDVSETPGASLDTSWCLLLLGSLLPCPGCLRKSLFPASVARIFLETIHHQRNLASASPVYLCKWLRACSSPLHMCIESLRNVAPYPSVQLGSKPRQSLQEAWSSPDWGSLREVAFSDLLRPRSPPNIVWLERYCFLRQWPQWQPSAPHCGRLSWATDGTFNSC